MRLQATARLIVSTGVGTVEGRREREDAQVKGVYKDAYTYTVQWITRNLRRPHRQTQ